MGRLKTVRTALGRKLRWDFRITGTLALAALTLALSANAANGAKATTPPSTAADGTANTPTKKQAHGKVQHSTMTYEKYTQAIAQQAPFDKSMAAALAEPEPKWENFDADAKQAKNNDRDSKDGEVRSPAMAPATGAPLDEFVKQVNATKSPEELDHLIKSLDDDYDQKDVNLKFLAVVLVPVREWRGFMWKMIPMFESSDTLHSIGLTLVQRYASLQRVLFPTEGSKFFAEYLEQPYVDSQTGQVTAQFRNEADFQAGLFKQYDAWKKSYDRLAALPLTAAKPAAFDKKLGYSLLQLDDLDRYRYAGQLEKEFLMSSIQASLAKLAMFRAYSVYDFFAVNSRLGRLYGLDGFFGKVTGAAAELRAEEVRRFSNYDLLLPDGQSWMLTALRHMRQSAVDFQKFYRDSCGKTQPTNFMGDLDYFHGSDREIGFAMENMKKMLTGPTVLVSHVTGEKVSVNMPEYFTHSPHDMKDLMAVRFEGGDEWLPKQLTLASGKIVNKTYRNYTKGRPWKWKAAAYNGFVSDLAVDQNGETEDIGRVARVMLQSWGGPFAGFSAADYIQ